MNQTLWVFYGKLNVANRLRLTLNREEMNPGVICNETSFPVLVYQSMFGNDKRWFLNPISESTMILFRDIPEHLEFFEFGKQVFVRPNSGKKEFTGGVISSAIDYEQLRYGKQKQSFDPLCILSQPQSILEEYRFVVVDNRVVTFSSYSPSITSFAPREALDFVNLFLSSTKWRPDFAFTIDVARLENDVYKIVEINSFSCSGLYSCDRCIIVDAINDYIRKTNPQ